MIYLLELPEDAAARAWFAFDADDLRRKLDAAGGLPACPMRVWPDEGAALQAFEDDAEPAWQGAAGWRARHALHAQLVATEVLTDL